MSENPLILSQSMMETVVAGKPSKIVKEEEYFELEDDMPVVENPDTERKKNASDNMSNSFEDIRMSQEQLGKDDLMASTTLGDFNVQQDYFKN